MKLEIKRLSDATRFEGNGSVGVLERAEMLKVGDKLVPAENEYSHEIEKELLTGKVLVTFKKGEYNSSFEKISDYLIGLEGIVDVKDFARRYNFSEDFILSKYLHLSSPIRDKILAENSGKPILLDDLEFTKDRGQVGILWVSEGEFVVYSPEEDKILFKKSPGLGINYGTYGKNDYLAAITEIIDKKKDLDFEEIITASNSIKDWDHYHWIDG